MFKNNKKHRLTVFGKRFLATLLALSMLFTFTPTAIAEGTELIDETITGVTDAVTETETEEEAVALSEITELREECSKTFLMSEGT